MGKKKIIAGRGKAINGRALKGMEPRLIQPCILPHQEEKSRFWGLF